MMTAMAAIERRVQGVLLVMLAALLVAIVIAFSFTNHMTTTAGWVSHTYAVMATIEETHTDIAQALSDTRAYAMTGNTAFLTRKNGRVAHLHERVEQLRQMTSDNAEEQAHVRTLATLIRTWQTRLDDVVRARAVQGFAAAASLVQKRHAATASDAISGVLGTMHAV